MTESLQIKKKITKLSKKEAGGEEKHVYFFTRPYIIFLTCDTVSSNNFSNIDLVMFSGVLSPGCDGITGKISISVTGPEN